MKKVKFIDKVS